MKKYKLIKKYPGSVEVGDIFIKKDDNQSFYTSEKNYGPYREKKAISKDNIENYPEYWEK